MPDRSYNFEVEDIIHSMYRAGAGLASWTEPLQKVATDFDLWIARLFALDRRNGALLFSHEAGPGSPRASSGWLHGYYRTDPFVALVAGAEEGRWVGCDAHFDDAYVANSAFFQRFLLPSGGRYSYGAKLAEDDTKSIVMLLRRTPERGHLAREERQQLQRIGLHLENAIAMRNTFNRGDALEYDIMLLERARQPLLVLDANRRIAWRNTAGAALLQRGDLVFDRDGFAVCRDDASDADFVLALRALVLAQAVDNPANESWERQGLWLKRERKASVLASLVALRSQGVTRAFGNVPLALLLVYETGSERELDPELLIGTFDFTPAEARVASRLASGLSVREIAADAGVSSSTVRSQLHMLFQKTGTKRQGELVRLLLLACEF